MRRRTTLITLLAFLTSAPINAGTISVRPEKCAIILPSDLEAQSASSRKKVLDAARELQFHIGLVAGQQPEVAEDGKAPDAHYPLNVDIRPPDDDGELATGEARWRVTPEAAYFYGNGDRGEPGVLAAVYDFLERQLGVRWIEPGDAGIAFKKRYPLTLTTGRHNWMPKLMQRTIRQGIRPVKAPPAAKSKAERERVEAHNRRVKETLLWRRRMRMGGAYPGGGHTFHEWWGKYGETDPELFALNKFGTREPVMLRGRSKEQSEEWVKICPSNPKVAELVVANWLKRYPRHREFISACVNDGASNFCRCEGCRRLDVIREGGAFADHLTDRYVHLANEVARRVRQHDPDTRVAMYAYLQLLRAPREIRVEPNVIAHMVPYVIPLEEGVTRDILAGWQKAGLKHMGFRPNYHGKYLTGGMPLGVEEQMFDVFQVAVEHGAISANYDSLMHRWPVTGIADYVLAKSMSEPAQPFAHWEDHYCCAYGPAAEAVRKYFRYWREELWEKRLLPDINEICARGGAGNFVRGLMWSLGKYYATDDFDKTDAILAAVDVEALTPREQARVRQLMLANRHTRLVYNAVIPPPHEKYEHTKRLTEFREKHRDELRLPWRSVVAQEMGLGDITGLKIADTMEDYLKPWVRTDLFWRFKPDPEDVGMEEQWHKLTYEQTQDWPRFRTDQFWEHQGAEDTTREADAGVDTSKYDGIGWYAQNVRVPQEFKGRKVYLRFGAVDESCWVYLNGELAGEHLYEKSDDWKTPFEIRIDPLIEWDKPAQTVMVRVEDKSGMGGVWKRVWLVSKK